MKNWNWLAIHWIAFLASVAMLILVPASTPEWIRWAPLLVLMYVAGRQQQQGEINYSKKHQPTLPATPHPIGHIDCYCGDQIPIYGDLELDGEPGEQTITISADTSALWLHSFTKHPDAHKED